VSSSLHLCSQGWMVSDSLEAVWMQGMCLLLRGCSALLCCRVACRGGASCADVGLATGACPWRKLWLVHGRCPSSFLRGGAACGSCLESERRAWKLSRVPAGGLQAVRYILGFSSHVLLLNSVMRHSSGGVPFLFGSHGWCLHETRQAKLRRCKPLRV
jgi:hypothetical protein